MKIGVFGGSFDPPHLGHAEILKYCLGNYEFSKIYLVPNYVSPFKELKRTTKEQNLEILKLFLKDLRTFKIDLLDFEINNPVKSYTIDTIKYLKNLHSEDEMYLIIGEDNFYSFDKWKDFSIILELAKVLVFRRNFSGNKDISENLGLYLNRFEFVENIFWDLSSSEWRNNPTSDKLSVSVFEYCKRNHLYGL